MVFPKSEIEVVSLQMAFPKLSVGFELIRDVFLKLEIGVVRLRMAFPKLEMKFEDFEGFVD